MEWITSVATVHNAGRVAHVLYEATKKRRIRCKFLVVDVAVQRLLQSKDELRHATNLRPKVNILR